MRKGQKKKVKLMKQKQYSNNTISDPKTTSLNDSLALASEEIYNNHMSANDAVATPSKTDRCESSRCSDSPHRRQRIAERLAIEGNKFFSLGLFEESAQKFTEAIAFSPVDVRLFGNRSACYQRLGKYVEALKDGDKCIELNPSWPKGYYRKGTVLKMIGKYEQAVKMFDHVLFFNKNCQEARNDRMDVMTEQLVEMGYPRMESRQLLELYECVTKAKIVLDKLSDFNKQRYYECKWCSTCASLSLDNDSLIDPKNPLKRTTLWVGNIETAMNENDVQNLFSRFGKILSIKILNDKRCAFVNFAKWQDAGKALGQLQGYKMINANLLLKYPDHSVQMCNHRNENVKQRKMPNHGALPNGECYFYRTTGCFHGDKCNWKHISENQGVDYNRG